MDEGPAVTAANAPDCFKASSAFDGGGNEDIADTSFSFNCARKITRTVKIDTIGYDRLCGVACVSVALYNNRKLSQILL